MAACAARETTWINRPLARLYGQLSQAGFAHAIEVRHEGALAGGIFAVTIGGAFFGESMVSLRPNASKMALLWCSAHLRRCGFTLFDTQFLTPHLARMGGTAITRAAYRKRLHAALRTGADIHAAALPAADQLWQEITQTS